jgi:hypothetical protein
VDFLSTVLIAARSVPKASMPGWSKKLASSEAMNACTSAWDALVGNDLPALVVELAGEHLVVGVDLGEDGRRPGARPGESPGAPR